MINCEHSNIPLGWSKHIIFLKWLNLIQHPAGAMAPLRIELLAATAWANDHYDSFESSRIVILDEHSNIAIGAIRPIRFSDPVKVMRLNQEKNRIISGEGFVYGVGTTWFVENWSQL